MSIAETSPAFQVIIDALDLARERVTADTIAARQDRRDAIKSMISAVYHFADTGQDKPASAELRGLLGDPGDAAIRRALEEWDAA